MKNNKKPKHFLAKCLVAIGVMIIGLIMLLVMFGIAPANAADESSNPPLCANVLTFRAWFCGVTKYVPKLDEDDNPVYYSNGEPALLVVMKEPGRDIELMTFVWTIILNILNDLFSLIGYIVTGFLLYGSFLYIISRGSSDQILKAKKTITNAIIGLVIVILATAIVSTITRVLTT